MSDIVLSVEVREGTGTGSARQTRRDGFVPGTLYGGELGPVSIAVKHNELQKAINSGQFLANLITIDHKGDKQTVFARDVQFDPVMDSPLHFDFQRVSEKDVISVEVAVQFVGEEDSPGLKRGGVLNVVRHAVEVDCPAGSIPEQIEVNLAGLEIGDSVHISAVELPEGVAPTISDRDFTIATVQGSRASRSADQEAGDEEGEEVEGDAEEGAAEE